MNLKFTAPTYSDIKEDCDKLDKIFNVFTEMSDEDIAPINELFYSSLRDARILAYEYGFSVDGLEAYYKLKMWFEMLENMELEND